MTLKYNIIVNLYFYLICSIYKKNLSKYLQYLKMKTESGACLSLFYSRINKCNNTRLRSRWFTALS